MIGDLLDYTRTRLGAGMPVTPVPMDLAALCREILSEVRSADLARTYRFECDGDVAGEWDYDRLRQAVSNLMGNAHQHGAPARVISLKVFAESASHVVVVVHNAGPAIPPGELTKIFDPLVRGSTAANQPQANRPGSIGLGLYVAREVARSHGGTIDVTSAEAEGTAFTMRLPRRAAAKVRHPILDDAHVQIM
jgi:signal transduction histidine kinase